MSDKGDRGAGGVGGGAAVTLGGRDYLIVPREEFDRLSAMARVAQMPDLPRPDKEGNYAGVEFMRATIARSIVKERARLGLTQAELAASAGVRVETVCRIETGKHTASTETLEKLDKALKAAAKKARVSERA